LRIIFFGSSAFSVPFLKFLYNTNHKIEAVVTNIDRVTGRGKKLRPNPVKVAASEFGIQVFEIEKINDEIYKKISAINFDIFVIVSFGHIIPKSLIELSNDLCINLHPSLLPKYRGPSPINSVLLNGDSETGVSIMKINEFLDSGDVYAQAKFKISKYDNKDMLEEKMIKIGAPLLGGVIDLIELGLIEPYPQEGIPTYTNLFKKEDLKITWTSSADEIVNKIRAFSSEPGAYAMFRGLRIKILSALKYDYSINYEPDIASRIKNSSPGEVLKADKELGLIVKCGENETIKIQELRIEGKKTISFVDFLNGYKVKVGDLFQ